MHLSVVIPTRNRTSRIARVLDSLSRQKRLPDTVIVIDGSDEPICEEVEQIVGATSLPVTYVRHWPPSAAAQRNRGLRELPVETDFVALIDDDLTLDPEAFKNALSAIDILPGFLTINDGIKHNDTVYMFEY